MNQFTEALKRLKVVSYPWCMGQWERGATLADALEVLGVREEVVPDRSLRMRIGRAMKELGWKRVSTSRNGTDRMVWRRSTTEAERVELNGRA
jgi:hypothetical protein